LLSFLPWHQPQLAAQWWNARFSHERADGRAFPLAGIRRRIHTPAPLGASQASKASKPVLKIEVDEQDRPTFLGKHRRRLANAIVRQTPPL